MDGRNPAISGYNTMTWTDGLIFSNFHFLQCSVWYVLCCSHILEFNELIFLLINFYYNIPEYLFKYNSNVFNTFLAGAEQIFSLYIYLLTPSEQSELGVILNLYW